MRLARLASSSGLRACAARLCANSTAATMSSSRFIGRCSGFGWPAVPPRPVAGACRGQSPYKFNVNLRKNNLCDAISHLLSLLRPAAARFPAARRLASAAVTPSPLRTFRIGYAAFAAARRPPLHPVRNQSRAVRPDRGGHVRNARPCLDLPSPWRVLSASVPAAGLPSRMEGRGDSCYFQTDYIKIIDPNRVRDISVLQIKY